MTCLHHKLSLAISFHISPGFIVFVFCFFPHCQVTPWQADESQSLIFLILIQCDPHRTSFSIGSGCVSQMCPPVFVQCALPKKKLYSVCSCNHAPFIRSNRLKKNLCVVNSVPPSWLRHPKLSHRSGFGVCYRLNSPPLFTGSATRCFTLRTTKLLQPDNLLAVQEVHVCF